MENKKFSDEELKSLKELQESYLRVQAKFGQIAIAKLTLDRQVDEMERTEDSVNTEFRELQKKEQDLVQELTKKYGQGQLDPQTGVFTPQESTQN